MLRHLHLGLHRSSQGVIVTGEGLANFIASMAESFPLVPGDRVLAVTTIAFDIAGLELYLPLVSGAAVVLAYRHEVTEPDALAELITAEGVSLMQATPRSTDCCWMTAPRP
ncbi:AMP-binding protein [Micromonospora sp. M12]